jgi:hypothetical protein
MFSSHEIHPKTVDAVMELREDGAEPARSLRLARALVAT